MVLTRAERAERVAAAARQVARDAWDNSWATPTRSDVARAVGLTIQAMDAPKWKEIIAEEFEAVEALQCARIHTASHKLCREYLEGYRKARNLSRAQLAEMIGANDDAFRRRVASSELLGEAVALALTLFRQVVEGLVDIDSLEQLEAIEDEPSGPFAVQCRCCIQWLGPDAINGFTPKCWAEYQEQYPALVRADDQATAELRCHIFVNLSR